MPLQAAAMPCSRMPKWKLRPAGVAAAKSPAPGTSVIVEGARSAEPPRNQGTMPLMA